MCVCHLQDQYGRNKVPDWQRVAGKAAKEVEKFAKEKADIVLMHWRDKMGIAQKEVSVPSPLHFRMSPHPSLLLPADSSHSMRSEHVASASSTAVLLRSLLVARGTALHCTALSSC